MARSNIDDVVVDVVREFGRPVRFREVADRLADKGISKSQAHNAIYRLGKRGGLRASGAGGAMTYVVP